MRNDIFGEKVCYKHLASPFILMALFNQFDNLYQSAADACFTELSWKQMFFLNAVTIFKEPPSIRDMADFMGCSHQNANKLYAKLIASEHIYSEQDRTDKRKQRIFLTEKGKKFLCENSDKGGKDIYKVFCTLTDDEMETVIESLYKLTSKLKDIE